ncbi:hypothetical protein BH11MYX4_BH11MYX4_65500 [soil metagenome]
MMIQCQHCGSQVRVTGSGTKDAAVIGSHIGQIGE